MQRKCKACKMAGAGNRLQLVLRLVEDASTGLRLSNSVSLYCDASSQQQVAGMQLCSSDIKFNFLLIANMQKHDPARDTDLHCAASPFERPSMY